MVKILKKSMLTRGISLFLAALLLAGLDGQLQQLSVYAASERADYIETEEPGNRISVWDGTMEEIVPEGDYYRIGNAAQFAWAAAQVNDGNSFSGKTLELLQTLDLSGINWKPIGNNTFDFQGTLEGNGFTIANLSALGKESYSGLFGSLGRNAVVRNLSLTNAKVSGSLYAGGIAGYSAGKIENCSVSGQVTRAGAGSSTYAQQNSAKDELPLQEQENLADFHEEVFVSSKLQTGEGRDSLEVERNRSGFTANLGGLAGYNASEGKIINCSGDVNLDIRTEISSGSTDIKIGGAIGYNDGEIRNSSIVSDINTRENVKSGNWTYSIMAGGFLGSNAGTAVDCSAKSNVAGSGNFMGGFCGYQTSGRLENCSVTGSVSQQYMLEEVGYANVGAGGFAGAVAGGTITNGSAQAPVTMLAADGRYGSYIDLNTGGFAGRYSYGLIDNSYAKGNVKQEVGKLMPDSFASDPRLYLGGFAGNARGTRLEYSYSAGKVTGTSASGTLNTHKGAFLGYKNVNTVNCYFDNTVSGISEPAGYGTAAGITGASTRAMMQKATYTGFDFTNVWNLSSLNNSGYPYLRRNYQSTNITLDQRKYTVIIVKEDGITPVPGAEVSITKPNGENIQAVSNEEGAALFETIGNLGLIDLKIEAAGYMPYISKGIADKNIRMHMGYLESADKKEEPHISSLQLYDKNNDLIDLLHYKKSYSTANKETFTIYSGIDWKGNGAGTVYLSQGGTRKISTNTGVFQNVEIGSAFEPGKPIYLYAEGKNGKTSKAKAIHLSTYSPAAEGELWGNDGGGIKLFDGFSAEIPEGKPLAGWELSLDCSLLPIQVEYDGETAKIAIGIKTESDDEKNKLFNQSNWKNWKETFKEVKESITKDPAEAKNKIKKLKSAYEKSKKPQSLKIKSGFELETETCGYLELIKTDNGKWALSEGGVVFQAKGSYNLQMQAYVGIPVYYEVGGGAEVGFEGKCINISSGTAFTPKFEGDFTIAPYFELGGGVGIAKVCTVGVSGEVKLGVLIRLQNDYRKLDLTGGLKIKVKALGFISASHEIAKGTWVIKEWGVSKNSAAQEEIVVDSLENFNIYDMKSYQQRDESNTGINAIWLGEADPKAVKSFKDITLPVIEMEITESGLQEAKAVSEAAIAQKLLSADPKSFEALQSKVLKEGISDEAQPKICRMGDKTVAVWIDTDPGRAPENNQILLYSVYDEVNRVWKMPIPVHDDGTSDYFPEISNSFIVWQNISKLQKPEDSINAAAKESEIWAAQFDGERFVNAQAVTGNELYDGMPTIAENGSKVQVTWVQNTENDIFGTSGTNRILTKSWSAEKGVFGEEQKLYETEHPVLYLETGYHNKQHQAVYALDMDNNPETSEDVELFVNGERYTENEEADTNPQIITNPDGTAHLHWYCSGAVLKTSFDNLEEAVSMLGTAAEVGTDDYKVLYKDGRPYAVLWCIGTEGKREIYVSYDLGEGFTAPTAVTTENTYVQYFDADCDKNGKLAVLYHDALVSQDYDIYDRKLKIAAAEPYCDITLLDAFAEGAVMREGYDFPVYMNIQNTGVTAVDEVEIIIAGENGSSQILELPQKLKPGEETLLDLTYILGSNTGEQELRITVKASKQKEKYLENNTLPLIIGQNDLKLTKFDVLDSETGKVLIAQVDNIGGSDCSDVGLLISKDSEGTEILSTESLGEIKKGSSKLLAVKLDPNNSAFAEGINIIFGKVISGSEEVSYANNEASAKVFKPEALESIVLNETELVLPAGKTYQLNAETFPGSIENYDLHWTSSKAIVAKVDKYGTVQALAPGEAQIVVSASYGAVTAVCNVEVTEPDIELKLNAAYLTMKPGEKGNLEAIKPSGFEDEIVDWSSSKPEAAAVDENGVITANAAGKTIITARLGEYQITASCRIDVVEEIPTELESRLEKTEIKLNLEKSSGEQLGIISSLPTTFMSAKSLSEKLIKEVRLIDSDTKQEIKEAKVTEIKDDRYVTLLQTEHAKKGKKQNVLVQVKYRNSEVWTDAGELRIEYISECPVLKAQKLSFELFRNKKGAKLLLSSSTGKIKDIKIDPTADRLNPNPNLFRIDENNGLFYLNSSNVKAGSYQVRFIAEVEGFKDSFSVIQKIGITVKQPKIKLSSSTVNMNPKSSQAAFVRIVSADKKMMLKDFHITNIRPAAEEDMFALSAAKKDAYLKANEQIKPELGYNPETGVFKVLLKEENSLTKKQSILLAAEISGTDSVLLLPLALNPVNSANTVKLSAAAVTLNSQLAPELGAKTIAVKKSPDNFEVFSEKYEIYNNETKKWEMLNEQRDQLSVSYSDNDGVLKIMQRGIKKDGSYRLRAVLMDYEGNQLSKDPLQFTVKVTSKVSVGLKKKSVSLNQKANVNSMEYDAAYIPLQIKTNGLLIGGVKVEVKAGAEWRELQSADGITVSYTDDNSLKVALKSSYRNLKEDKKWNLRVHYYNSAAAKYLPNTSSLNVQAKAYKACKDPALRIGVKGSINLTDSASRLKISPKFINTNYKGSAKNNYQIEIERKVVTKIGKKTKVLWLTCGYFGLDGTLGEDGSLQVKRKENTNPPLGTYRIKVKSANCVSKPVNFSVKQSKLNLSADSKEVILNSNDKNGSAAFALRIKGSSSAEIENVTIEGSSLFQIDYEADKGICTVEFKDNVVDNSILEALKKNPKGAVYKVKAVVCAKGEAKTGKPLTTYSFKVIVK